MGHARFQVFHLFIHRLSVALFLKINFLYFNFGFAFKHIEITVGWLAAWLAETKSINILYPAGYLWPQMKWQKANVIAALISLALCFKIREFIYWPAG